MVGKEVSLISISDSFLSSIVKSGVWTSILDFRGSDEEFLRELHTYHHYSLTAKQAND